MEALGSPVDLNDEVRVVDSSVLIVDSDTRVSLDRAIAADPTLAECNTNLSVRSVGFFQIRDYDELRACGDIEMLAYFNEQHIRWCKSIRPAMPELCVDVKFNEGGSKEVKRGENALILRRLHKRLGRVANSWGSSKSKRAKRIAAMARDRLLEVVKFAKSELKNYADVLTYSQEPGAHSGVLLILHPLLNSCVEFEIMFDITNNDDVVVSWLCDNQHKFSDNGVFNLNTDGWRTVFGGVEMYLDAAANAVDIVENDRKVMT